ncbi:DoxX family protein [Aliivibrio sp. S4TY2]|uniref:DoxX family protein n=1 Tax=unclassified Aliivibrio TaxID=2645654 RepID=UPI002379DC57|nr:MULTISPECIES: DoxX family protein [unclassified Aliivibrio]MDD9155237.1 DoxX family protein [Aliivibrio sp. S4TY2]MDD9159211.1 DoxX family protein [Aliivibrio sp. S4TY1]MDD9163239.1 DoxX family protein [Aliivibrio sp. S4MY2]MDD9167210.1 DoxX family protein [Aliivibrio sp. S4MY4]MDD9184316.1 DoxX family protein [Aliivibrio sp. S4MY3]
MLLIQGLLIAIFLFASSIKMFGWVKAIFEPQLAFFHRYGLNRAAMFAVGVIEATGAVVMLVGMFTANPVLSAMGASLITLTSIGAMFFHFRFDTWKDAVPSMVTLLLSLIIALPLLERQFLF